VHIGEWNAPYKEQKEILALTDNLEFLPRKERKKE